MKTASPVLYPQVTRLPSSPGVGEQAKTPGESAIQKGEFDQALDRVMQNPAINGQQPLTQPTAGIKFSAHAAQRLRERKIQFDPETLARMNDAITKADSKGVQDTLMLTDSAAMIVNVPNRTVITAMDRNNLTGNVFTNIDGAVIV